MALNAAHKVRLAAIISQNLNDIKDNDLDEGINDSQAFFAFQSVLADTITLEQESTLKTWGVWDNIATIRSFIEHPAPQNRVENDEYLIENGVLLVENANPGYVYYIDANRNLIEEQKGLLNLSAENTVIINADYIDLPASPEALPNEEEAGENIEIDDLSSPGDAALVDLEAALQNLDAVLLDSHLEAVPIPPSTPQYIVENPITKEDVTGFIEIEVGACIQALQAKNVEPFEQVDEYLQKIMDKGYTVEDFETLYNGGLEFIEVNALLGVKDNQEAINDIFSRGRGEALQWVIQKDRSDIIRSLLEVPEKNKKIPDQDKASTLLWAAEQGHLDVLEKMLEAGANPNVVDEKGYTLLMHAAKIPYPDMVDCLIHAKGIFYETLHFKHSEHGTATNIALKYSTDLLDKARGEQSKVRHDELLQASKEYSTIVKNILLVIDLSNELVKASESNDTEQAKSLLERGATPNIVGDRGSTPLHFACENQNTELAKILLETGANPNYENINLDTALHVACIKGSLDLVNLLLSYKANPNAIEGKEGLTSLHSACRENKPAIVMALLEAGADRHAVDMFGQPPLHTACGPFATKIADILIERGVEINAIANNGRTALHNACYFNCPDTVSLLLDNGANPNVFNNKCESPLRMAQRNDCPEIIKALLEAGARNINGVYEDCLKTFSMQGDVDITTMLLENRADLNDVIDKQGANLLHHACDRGDIEMAELLLYYGTSLNKVDNAGNTPLMNAARGGYTEIVDAILQLQNITIESLELNHPTDGSAADIADKKGHSEIADSIRTSIDKGKALFDAIEKKDSKSVQELLTGDINLDIRHRCTEKNPQGSSLLVMALYNEDIVKLLLEAGADPHYHGSVHIIQHACVEGKKGIVSLYLNHGVSANIISLGDDCYPLLTYACDAGHTEIVKLLLDHGADIPSQGPHENSPSPFMISAKKGYTEIVDLLITHPQMTFEALIYNNDLYQEASSLALANGHEELAKRIENVYFNLKTLYHASQNGKVQTVKELLENKGLNPNISFNGGYTALYLACESGHDAVVEELLAAGAYVDGEQTNILNGLGSTALHIAKSPAIITRLLAAGANPRLTNNNGDTPLIEMASKEKSFMNVEALLTKGNLTLEDIQAKNYFNKTALETAKENGRKDIILLIEKKIAELEFSAQAPNPNTFSTPYVPKVDEEISHIARHLEREESKDKKKERGVLL